MAAAQIREARPGDVPAITEIYNEAVATTTGTFDTEPGTVEDRTDWLQAHDSRHPVLVAEREGCIVAWGALSPFSERRAYAGTAEIHVYVSAGDRGQGFGTSIVQALLAEGRRSGLHAILARIASGNDISRHIHESLGFREVGTLREVGTKFGRLLDVHILEYIYPERTAGPS